MNATELHPDNNEKPGSIPGGRQEAPYDFQYEQGLPPHEVHRRAAASAAMLCRAGRALGAWLVEIDDRKLYRYFSCSSVYHYASRYLNLAGHTVAEHLRTGRKLAELPLLATAYEKGELSATHVREITRVATAGTESFWCETAKRSTTRTIEKLVAFTPKGGLPPRKEVLPPRESATQAGLSRTQNPAAGSSVTAILPHGGETSSGTVNHFYSSAETDSAASLATAHLPGGTSARQSIDPQDIATQVRFHDRLVVEVTAEDMAILKDAFRKARRESGKNDRRSHLLHMARAFLQGPPRGREGQWETGDS